MYVGPVYIIKGTTLGEEIEGSLQLQCINKPAVTVILTLNVPKAILFMTFWLL